jgi:hypothetical protein
VPAGPGFVRERLHHGHFVGIGHAGNMRSGRAGFQSRRAAADGIFVDVLKKNDGDAAICRRRG